jgi:hypothetical protein
MTSGRALRMPPDIVIRPSGVWDSRAPLHNFLSAHRRTIRTYNSLTLAVNRLTHDARQPGVALRSAKKWLKADTGAALGGRAWGNYRRALYRTTADTPASPSIPDFVSDLSLALYDIRRQTILWHASLFETFAQCWALNYLLSVLEDGNENGREWSRAERGLAEAFSPEHGADELPSLPRILRCCPFLEAGLAAIPAFVTTAASDDEEEAPVSVDVNALQAVRSWRAVRNLIVHRGGIVSSRFLTRHGQFFAWLRSHYSYMQPLEVGSGVLFYDDVVRSVFAVHFRAARWMSDLLERRSACRRGHPHAPGPKPDVLFFPGQPPPSPAMVLPGDHAPSLSWATSMSFRTAFRLRASRDPRGT